MADKETQVEKPQVAPTGDVATEQPAKEDWQSDPRLDENGNPKKEVTVEPAAKPEVEQQEKTEEQPSEEKPTDKVDFNAPVVKQVEGLVTAAGLDAQAVAKAVMDNDGKLPPAMAEALTKQHGELVASLIADKLEGFHEGVKTQAQAREKQVFSTLEEAFKDVTTQSGAETWKELKGWAKDNIPSNERSEINAMLAKGGYQAELALNALVTRFKSKEVTQQAPQLEDGAVNVKTGVQPISKSEYLRKFDELEAKGHVYGESREFVKLDAQRQAGLKRGM